MQRLPLWMRSRIKAAPVLLVCIAAGAIPACTPLDVTLPFGPCAGEVAFPWVITGLSAARVIGDSSGRGVTVVMTLGETVRLRVEASGLGGCVATVGSVGWSSSNPAVATLAPIALDEASLTSVGLGETVLTARLVFVDSPSQVVSPQVSSDSLGLRDVSHVRVVAP